MHRLACHISYLLWTTWIYCVQLPTSLSSSSAFVSCPSAYDFSSTSRLATSGRGYVRRYMGKFSLGRISGTIASSLLKPRSIDRHRCLTVQLHAKSGKRKRRSDYVREESREGVDEDQRLVTDAAEMSRCTETVSLTRKNRHIQIEADEAERAALAKRFSLEGMQHLTADVWVMRVAGRENSRIRVKGRVSSEIVQLCAVTLEPFTARIDEDFETIIQEISSTSVDSALWGLDDAEVDDDIMEGAPLDVGELVAQTVSLAIDPYATDPNLSDQDVPFAQDDKVLDVDTMNAFFKKS